MTPILRDGVRNSALDSMDQDYLYHLGLDSSMDLKAMFGDVKFVCMGGSPDRAEAFAAKAAQELGIEVSEGDIRPIGKTERFSLYKIGPVISVSHGMGMPSMSILLHELAKLLHYAGCEDTQWFRIGTSGGVGVEAGTAVISNGAVNGQLESVFEQIELGMRRRYPVDLDQNLAQALAATSGDIKTALGLTMGTDDFYEGQGRRDGAFEPNYSDEEKMEFLEKAYEFGVRNIEMESVAFAAFCLRAGIPAAIVCAALLNRLEGDQVTSTPEQLGQYADNAQQVVINYIRARLGVS